MTVRQEDHPSPRKREEKENELEGPSLSRSLIHNDQPPGPQQVLWVTWHRPMVWACTTCRGTEGSVPVNMLDTRTLFNQDTRPCHTPSRPAT